VRTKFLVLGFALCLITAPARADLFGFTVSNTHSTFDGVSLFKATYGSSMSESYLYRNTPPAGAVKNFPGYGGTDFLISMTISNINITAGTADGSGTLMLKDYDGDALSGNLSGHWTGNSFRGSLTNVTFAQPDFDGWVLSFPSYVLDDVSMAFNSPQSSWSGTVIEVTAGGDFRGSFDVTGGSVDATIVPVPAAFLLGLLGMGAAGLKLRKYA
jgi:hypothetical protein